MNLPELDHPVGTGKPLPLVFDGGVEGGLDILRAIALGADYVMMGRGWHYALAALGPTGPGHLAQILKSDLQANMGQLGIRTLEEVRNRVVAPSDTPPRSALQPPPTS